MSQSIFQVRPQDAGKGWAIDEYDGRGAWQSTYSKNAKGEPLDKQEAQRRVFQLRRKALNSAKTEAPVNKVVGDGVVAKASRPLPYVQVGMMLVCPDDGAAWWEVEGIYDHKGEPCATVRSCDVRRLIEVPCASIRDTWSLYEDFDPAAVET